LVVLAVALATLLPFRAQAQESVYRIGPEDVLRITVWKNDAMSGTIPVRPDGKISLLQLNDIQAAGLTALELREVITQRLQEYERNPEVSVIVQEIRSLRVSVIGEVTRPGRYELKSGATVLPLGQMPPLMWDGILMPSGRPFPR